MGQYMCLDIVDRDSAIQTVVASKVVQPSEALKVRLVLETTQLIHDSEIQKFPYPNRTVVAKADKRLRPSGFKTAENGVSSALESKSAFSRAAFLANRFLKYPTIAYTVENPISRWKFGSFPI
jgi:hypothetical protein